MQISSVFVCLLLALVVKAQHDESEDQRSIGEDGRPALPPIGLKHPYQIPASNPGNYYVYQLQHQQQRTGNPLGSSQQFYYVSLSDYANAMQQGHFQRPMMSPAAMDYGPPMHMPYYPPMQFMSPYQPQGMPVVPMTFQRGGTQLPKNEHTKKQEESIREQEEEEEDKESAPSSPQDSGSDLKKAAAPSRSGQPAQTNMFTNAHHYPFPQGLMQMYYQHYPSASSPESEIKNSHHPISPVPPSFYYVYPNGSPYLSPSGEPLAKPSVKSPNNSDQQPSISEPSAKQTGKTSGNEGEEDSSSSTPVRIYKYSMPGFSHLGDMYVPVYGSSERGAANSRV